MPARRCWDGRHLDSADHKSHMRYAGTGGAWPASHPVSLPAISYELDYPGITGALRTFYPAVANTPCTAIYLRHGAPTCKMPWSTRA